MPTQLPSPPLTTPDLVTLSLLSERPMHGYELNQTLEYRQVRDWAGISRAQVYYSLKKLAQLGLIEAVAPHESRGPERQPFGATPAGRQALVQALDRDDWANQRPPPPFLTWLALSTHADRAAVARQIDRRRRFLQDELQRERATLDAIRADQGEMVVVAELMVELTISQFETELDWLDGVGARLESR